jgi:hypothetical protein
MKSPRRITLRNPSRRLTQRLLAISRRRGQSLSATILRVLEEAVGIDATRRRLRRYVSWSEDQLREFEQTLRAQRRIDQRPWQP